MFTTLEILGQIFPRRHSILYNFKHKGLCNRSSNPSMLFTFRYSQHSNLAPKSLQNRSPSRHGNCWGQATRRVQRPIFDGFFDALLLKPKQFRLGAVPLTVCANTPMLRNVTQQKSIQNLQMVINYTDCTQSVLRTWESLRKKPIRLESVCCAI